MGDEATEYFMRDRLTWKWFLGLGISDPVPDANTIWTFREHLTKANAIKGLFERFDAGYLAMSGNSPLSPPPSSAIPMVRRPRSRPEPFPTPGRTSQRNCGKRTAIRGGR